MFTARLPRTVAHRKRGTRQPTEAIAFPLHAERSRALISPDFFASRCNEENIVMDKDRIAGSAKEIKGSVEETIGKATGDAKLQADGKADKLEGRWSGRRGLSDNLPCP
jgi:uncharacterized protein YjbJ (UPF0337 family)